MKMLAKIFLGLWVLIIVGIYLYCLITDLEATLSITFLVLGCLVLIYGPFWAMDQLSK